MANSTFSSQANKDLVENYKQSFFKEVEVILSEVFPKKIIELDTLYKSDKLALSQLPVVAQASNVSLEMVKVTDKTSSEQHAPPPKRKRESVENGAASPKNIEIVSNNTVICNLISIVKPEIRELVEYCNQVKMWIQLLIPKIEDGNNFGVSIQEETISEVTTVCESVKVYYDEMSRYFVTRGKVASKVVKYPNLLDYTRYLTELDEKQFLHIRAITNELKMIYCCLFDIINKNFDKIKQPRSLMSTNLY